MRPRKWNARLDAARALHRAGDAAGAEPVYRALLRRDPRDPDALHLLGLVRAVAGDHAEAAALFRRAVGVRPDDGSSWNNLGNALLCIGDPAEARGPSSAPYLSAPDCWTRGSAAPTP
ncbi:tetratricopeptide repeat protein [Roseomonas sp. CCTCC AB2023176]|uniref:tetratricopeptide repeat protein n=1 Tax=Roseomonas sp. CCTCC AB2023176 TaxID=3342640 RepID=UPI0035D75941